MNTKSRRALLARAALPGLYGGVRTEFFPGLGRHRISLAGAYDEHLIALAAASIAGVTACTAVPARIAILGILLLLSPRTRGLAKEQL